MARKTIFVSDLTGKTIDEKDAATRGRLILPAGEQAGELRDQRLEDLLRLVRRLAHLHEFVLAAK